MSEPNDPHRASDDPTIQHGDMLRALPVDPDRTRIVTSLGDSLPRGAAPSREEATTGFQLVGRYQILERIGRGAMATVYKAYDPGIDRTLALKFLHHELCTEEEYRSRFVREAKAAGAISHHNIVTVFDVGEIEGRPYIAMELIDGVSLSETVRPDVGLPPREVAEIGVQLARALDYAHSKGVFHRDIKPSNIMRLNGSNTIKVTDFGIAHIDGSQHTQQTRVGTVLGTPQYMSPEQAMGDKVDGRSDLFSVGVVLYQLLTGHAPFEATSLVTLAHRIAKQEPTAIDKVRRDVPPALRRVIERCLRKQPEKRFQTGAELAEALQRVINDLDQEVGITGKPRVVPLRVKWTVTMAVIVAITMAVTAAFVTQRQYTAMMRQVMDYGSSLATFLATENAASALAQEWVNVDVSVRDIMDSQRFHEITVVDRQGVVQVSSNPALVEQPYHPQPGTVAVETRPDGVAVRSYETAEGESILDFDVPITFKRGDQRIEIGRLHLGIPERPLSAVARLSLMWMALLVLVTTLAVSLATYVIADRYSRPLRLLRDSMAELGKGRFDYRIAEQRNDEFGQVYRSFDSMAQALQTRVEPDGGGKATPPPVQ